MSTGCGRRGLQQRLDHGVKPIRVGAVKEEHTRGAPELMAVQLAGGCLADDPNDLVSSAKMASRSSREPNWPWRNGRWTRTACSMGVSGTCRDGARDCWLAHVVRRSRGTR